uniref:Uncharacterized protein n=1 Tax=Fagus sylvatica TaxID=28930 RepID=A0A2N9HL82_FAGSY
MTCFLVHGGGCEGGGDGGSGVVTMGVVVVEVVVGATMVLMVEALMVVAMTVVVYGIVYSSGDSGVDGSDGGVVVSSAKELKGKALEKASKNKALIDAIGEPIVRGPWYNASLAVAHKRHSVSCTFPVSGPQGSGVFQLKAVRNGDDSWFSFLRRDWDILIMDALLHVPANDEKHQTLRISISDTPAPAFAACTDCKPQEPEIPEKK